MKKSKQNNNNNNKENITKAQDRCAESIAKPCRDCLVAGWLAGWLAVGGATFE